MARTPLVLDIPALGALERGSGNLSGQLAQLLRDAIHKGEISPGDALPSTRLLAASLHVARGTVVEAYEQLIAEGFLESQRGAATRVAEALSGTGAGAGARAGATRVRKAHTAAGRALRTSLPEPAERFARVAREFSSLPPMPFAVSVPVGLTAPADIWRRLGNRVRAKGPGAPAGYDDPKGAMPLREAIAAYARKSRSVHCDASQVIITSGTQQGLYLACQVLLGSKDQAWVEDPAYRGITATLENNGRGSAMIRVPVDDEGIDVEAGIRQAPHAKVAFVTPSHQYPLGMPLSTARRSAILAWARSNDAWVVEDDYDSEFRYEGYPFPSLHSSEADRVVYLGTFSKILFPSLRLGYVIAPHDLADAFCGARVLMDRHPPNADQHVLAAFMADGHLERHIRRVRNVYANHRAQLIAAIHILLPPALAWVQPGDQGMHLVLWLKPSLDDREVVAMAARAGVAVRAVSPMFSPGNGRPGLVLGFGGFSHAQMQEAAQRLAAVIIDAVNSGEGPRSKKPALALKGGTGPKNGC